MTKPPKDRDTTVRIREDKGAPDGVKFDFQNSSAGPEKQKYENDGHDGFLIEFKIKDQANSGLLFPKSPCDALWVHPVANEHGPCPSRGAQWDQFVPIEVIDGGETLVVRNYNKDVQLFKFSLNFTRDREDPTSPLVCWDPIGENRNGFSLRSFSSSSTIVPVAIAVGAASALSAAAVLAWHRKH